MRAFELRAIMCGSLLSFLLWPRTERHRETKERKAAFHNQTLGAHVIYSSSGCLPHRTHLVQVFEHIIGCDFSLFKNICKC